MTHLQCSPFQHAGRLQQPNFFRVSPAGFRGIQNAGELFARSLDARYLAWSFSSLHVSSDRRQGQTNISLRGKETELSLYEVAHRHDPQELQDPLSSRREANFIV